MNTLDFVNLAVSKDDTRYNLCSAYRDTNKLVGTDGHRLHWVNSLPDATPSFVDGRNEQFPDYSRVMPTGSPSYSFQFKAEKGDEKRLKALLALAKACDSRCPSISLYVRDSRIVFHLVDKTYNTTATVELFGECKGDTSLIVGANFSYVLDAITPALKGLGKVSIEPHGKHEPIKITSELPGQVYHAIVMPIRL